MPSQNPSVPTSSPRAEYQRRADQHRQRAAAAARSEETVSRLRLVVALVAALVLAFALGGRLSGGWLVLAAVAFASLLVVHARVRAHRRLAERGAVFYERG